MTNEEALGIISECIVRGEVITEAHSFELWDKVQKALNDVVHPRVIIQCQDGEEILNRGLTLEELKSEARRQGFVLVRKNRGVQHLKCVCGKFPSMWCIDDGYQIRCSCCERAGMIGDTVNKAWMNWNSEVKKSE